eukprot:6318507-Heterocapsa_arctica.AAC.1
MYRNVSKCTKDLNPPFANPSSAFSQGAQRQPLRAPGRRRGARRGARGAEKLLRHGGRGLGAVPGWRR